MSSAQTSQVQYKYKCNLMGNTNTNENTNTIEWQITRMQLMKRASVNLYGRRTNKNTQCAFAWHLSASACMSEAVLICGYAQTYKYKYIYKIQNTNKNTQCASAWHLSASACMSGALLICRYVQQYKTQNTKYKIQKPKIQNTKTQTNNVHLLCDTGLASACMSAGANRFKCIELMLGHRD